jgi:hypothetical protein
MFQSTFEREQYIGEDVGARGGGTVEDAAKRLSCSPDQIRWLVQTGELDAFGVRLQDGSLDIHIPEAEIQRFGHGIGKSN